MSSGVVEPRSYYLLDHRQGKRVWNPTRRLPDATGSTGIASIVHHTAENHPDWVKPDGGGEAVARYGATTKRDCSWHATTDSDSIIFMLPDRMRAYHCHVISNSSLGVECAYKAHLWGTHEGWYENAHLENLSRLVAYWCVRHDIPPVWRTMDEILDGARGLIPHGWADPTRRSDPGCSAKLDRKTGRRNYKWTTFPVDNYMERLEKNIADQKRKGLYLPQAWIPGEGPKAKRAAKLGVKPETLKPVPPEPAAATPAKATAETALAEVVQVKDWRSSRSAATAVQQVVGTPADGVWGPNSRRAAQKWAEKVKKG